MTQPPGFAVVGDIGGTNVRFALAGAEGLEHPWAAPCDCFTDVFDALAVFLADAGHPAVRRIALAVAGPITDGRVVLTNNGWEVSEQALRREGFVRACLLNDFAALAMAAPHLQASGREMIGSQTEGLALAPIVVLGPGTGLGVAALVRDVAVATEGGHIGFSPTDDIELGIARILTRDLGRVSVERLLSGSGLARLHSALTQIEGRLDDGLDQRRIVEMAVAGDDACRQTIARFWAILASVSGDLALTYGAKGGVYLGGGVLPRIIDFLDAEAFRRRFEAKGRMSAYNAAIPTWLITDPHAALRGAARALAT